MFRVGTELRDADEDFTRSWPGLPSPLLVLLLEGLFPSLHVSLFLSLSLSLSLVRRGPRLGCGFVQQFCCAPCRSCFTVFLHAQTIWSPAFQAARMGIHPPPISLGPSLQPSLSPSLPRNACLGRCYLHYPSFSPLPQQNRACSLSLSLFLGDLGECLLVVLGGCLCSAWGGRHLTTGLVNLNWTSRPSRRLRLPRVPNGGGCRAAT